MNLTPTQQKVLDQVQAQGKATITTVATALDMTVGNAQRNLRFLREAGYVHIVEQDTSKPRMPVNIYAYGEGEEVQRKAAQIKQDAARKAFTKRNTYDPTAPVMPNTGWVSTIHSKDYAMSHIHHILFMERFKPHPDHAAVWLFNKPKVALLGARYDLV